jgi:hypothetical protein
LDDFDARVFYHFSGASISSKSSSNLAKRIREKSGALKRDSEEDEIEVLDIWVLFL